MQSKARLTSCLSLTSTTADSCFFRSNTTAHSSYWKEELGFEIKNEVMLLSDSLYSQHKRKHALGRSKRCVVGLSFVFHNRFCWCHALQRILATDVSMRPSPSKRNRDFVAKCGARANSQFKTVSEQAPPYGWLISKIMAAEKIIRGESQFAVPFVVWSAYELKDESSAYTYHIEDTG